MDSITDIRNNFASRLKEKRFVDGTVEIVGATFLADEETIFGAINEDYISRELSWYLSQSLFVDEIPGGAPKIWKQIASDHGEINSNYGYLMHSTKNGDQLTKVVDCLISDPKSRRAVAVYTRPSIHDDWNRDGMADFICTNAVQYLIRDGKLHVVVQMRSNDAIFGYRNDYAWQKYMQEIIAAMLHSAKVPVTLGRIIWNVGSLHVYERHFWLLEEFAATGQFNLSLT